MRKVVAIILLVLFSLGTFGVSIEQHLCCHSAQTENASQPNHCNDDESCCGENDDCCDEIVSQVQIANDFISVDATMSLDFNGIAFLHAPIFYSQFIATIGPKHSVDPAICYFPPPKDFQIYFSSFLI